MSRINISIPDDTLKKLDRYRYLVNSTRSGLIREAVNSYFAKLDSRILEERKRKAIKDIAKIRDRVGEELKGWDSTGDIKKLRNER
ncbi:MAG: ribbon-helix-helix protein, CopG family [Actinomycetota bacterium]|nr:ribbon-helix-helix protein, CopG family [Actinomycetota bacterium]